MLKNGNDFKKLRALIQDIKIAMLTTLSQEGAIESRPMMLQEIDDQGELWFFTSIDSEKTKDLQLDPRVNLTFSSPEKSQYISISGNVTVVLDRDKTRELWNPLNKAWFTGGAGDSTLVLLRIIPQTAEFWDAPHGKVVQFLGMAKAVITGKEYRANSSEHVRL